MIDAIKGIARDRAARKHFDEQPILRSVTSHSRPASAVFALVTAGS
jgi:hypothetical protein